MYLNNSFPVIAVKSGKSGVTSVTFSIRVTQPESVFVQASTAKIETPEEEQDTDWIQFYALH